MFRIQTRLIGLLFLFVGPLLPSVSIADGPTNVYSTRFEVAEGYDPRYELTAQQGWVSYGANSGGNGLVTNFLGSQAAYVGLFPISPRGNFLSVWQPLNYVPPTNRSIVKFSVQMAVIDSSNGERDDFYWSVYNSQGDRLFTLDFDNNSLGIYYVLDGTNNFVFTGQMFTNDTPYQLLISMDFGQRTWSAALDNASLATNQPLTTTGAPLNLGDVDAVWAIYTNSAPGDNFMLFDNYQVTAESAAPPPVRLIALGPPVNGQFALRLNGSSGSRYAIEATTDWGQWLPLKTNVVTDGFFDFIDTGASAPWRFYRARWVP